MKKFIIKLIIFSLPIIIYVGYTAYTILILPIDAYTFRVWEALSVYENNKVLSGPFYPNMYIKKTEVGDLAHMEEFNVQKEVEWYTDKYGYRTKETGQKGYDIVIIGDSLTAGSSLDQKDTLASMLSEKTGMSVYPFAPGDINEYLSQERFEKYPPKIVVLETAEKVLLHVPAINAEEQTEPGFFERTFLKDIEKSKLVTRIAILLDRLKKKSFTEYLTARLLERVSGFWQRALEKRLESVPQEVVEKPYDPTTDYTPFPPEKYGGRNVSLDETMVFYEFPYQYFIPWEQDEEIDNQIARFKEYQKYFDKNNIKFIVLPVPNKENIYYKIVYRGKKVDNLERFIKTANTEGVPTVDVESAFENAYNSDPQKLLYHIDDSHWNPYGVDIASTLLARQVKEELQK